jgi:hypothetical protein
VSFAFVDGGFSMMIVFDMKMSVVDSPVEGFYRVTSSFFCCGEAMASDHVAFLPIFHVVFDQLTAFFQRNVFLE